MTITYSYPIYWVLFLGAIIVAGLIFSFYTSLRSKFNPLFLGGIACIGLIYTIAVDRERVTLDNEKLEQHHGSLREGFPLNNLSLVTISYEVRRVGTKRKVKEIWTASYTNQESIKVKVDGLWKANGADIAQRLRDRGITVNDLR